MSLVTPSPVTASQTVTPIGTFNFTDTGWNTYAYVPCVDTYGNLVSVTLSGAATLRETVGINPNIGFYMLTPVAAILTPGLQYSYPDGAHPFEPTNHFTFTVGPNNGSAIAKSGIDLVMNGVDVTSQLTLTQSGNSWVGSLPISSNAVYAGVLNVTNGATPTPQFSTFNISFDTFSISNYQWEAVDYDFSTNNGSAWISGLYINNPVPTCDITATQTGTLETNSYFGYPTGLTPGNDPNGMGAVAQQGIDINFPNDGQTLTSEFYRADGVGSQPASDYVRPKFLAEQTLLNDPHIGPLNIGYYGNGYWLNYTRNYPTNNYNVWGRIAGINPLVGTSLSQVTSGVGTTSQATTVLGTFSDPNAVGYQAWHWIPLLDANSNKVVVPLGGKATLRVTSGNNLNTEFFMLVPAVAAPLQLQLAAVRVGNQIQISLPTLSGTSYTLMYSASLTAPHWTAVGSPLPGNGAVQSFTQATSGSQGYYQVVAQ
jgi:hypothetical protein